ncbi:MAG: hypothetical protein JWO12_1697, partial [Frankiales bacterium]|nr:hypothetical protein [Frankiales bacterium]
KKVMGAYFPDARYCFQKSFEHGGWDGCLES